MEKEYAQALFDLAQKPGASADELVKKLTLHLKESGREKLLPRILREYKRVVARNESFGELLEVAHVEEKAVAEREATELGVTAAAQVNPDLISGWRARKGGRLIDRSGKRALLDLYRAIVQNA
jgi:F0F1-type ATP synthase delta subunit